MALQCVCLCVYNFISRVVKTGTRPAGVTNEIVTGVQRGQT